MNFFEYILAPFIFIIEQLFTFSYDLTGNYGIAILLLSFGISLLLLPIFIYIEKAKKKDDVIKNKMQPLIDEIKRVYKGQERFYYIKTINRQHNYSSLKALIPILSLLIQIPFFIAAYQFLEGFAPLKDVSFLLIPDLSQPDGLFGMVNVLPIIMTIVNVLTAYYYTRNGNNTELKQMLVLAAVFLVLLFNLPAGLVLYWTMNNVFSFLRMFITNPEVFRKNKIISEKPKLFSKYKTLIPQLKKVFAFLAIGFSIFQINWAFRYSFDDIILRLLAALGISILLTFIVGLLLPFYYSQKAKISKMKIRPTVYFSLLFLVAYFFLASKYYFTGINTNLSIIACLILIPLQFLGFLSFKRNVNSIKYFALFGLFLKGLFATQLINIYTIIANKDIVVSVFNIDLNISLESGYISIVTAGLIFSLITGYFLVKLTIDKFTGIIEEWKIYLLSVVYILGLIFFWNPMIVYSSFTANFSFPAIQILANNYLFFFIGIVISSIIYALVSKKIKRVLMLLLLIISVTVFLYSTIIPFNVGTLQVNFFSEENNLAASIIYFIGESILLLFVVLGLTWLVKKDYNKYIIIGLLLINLVIIGDGLFSSISTGDFFEKHQVELSDSNKEYRHKIVFSKTEQNVLYYVIDGAQGWYMKDITEKDTSLLSAFEGFVWYPNTISNSNYTHSSMPSMIGGPEYTVENMDKRTDLPISKKITESTQAFYDKIREQDYYFTGNSFKYSNIDHDLIDNYIPPWSEDWNVFLDNKEQNNMWFTRLWENALFSSSPLFLKSKIYNKNKWIVTDNAQNSNELNKYNSVKILPQISDTNCHKKSFIFIHSLFSHAPWDMITKEGEFIRDVHPFDNQQWFTYEFANWIKWMKENDVYDNTKIILVSDHGQSWWHSHHGLDKSLPIKWDDDKSVVSLMQFLRLNPLLMVKDYNAKGKMKEDWKLMSNSDAYSIAFNENDSIMNDKNRTVKAYYTKWINDMYKRNKYINNNVYEIKDNVFDINNWKEITDLIDIDVKINHKSDEIN